MTQPLAHVVCRTCYPDPLDEKATALCGRYAYGQGQDRHLCTPECGCDFCPTCVGLLNHVNETGERVCLDEPVRTSLAEQYAITDRQHADVGGGI